MPIIIRKSVSPGHRKVAYVDGRDLTRKKPERSLTMMINRHAGRDRTGKISIRHQGGGPKRKYRRIEFGQRFIGQKGIVQALEYDPYRTAFIALVEFGGRTKSYILAPKDLHVNDTIEVANKTPIKVGNRLKLVDIPSGVEIHNIELVPGSGGKLVRGAGTSAVIQAKEGSYALVKLPSGEIRRLHLQCFASVGLVSNPDHNSIQIGKAGRVRLMGIRPTVRGKAMYPAAHPHGGGEGVNPIGLKHPKTFTGQPARGVKTRNRKKPSTKFIVKRRK